MNTEDFSAVARAYAACRPHYPHALFEYLRGVSPGRERAWDCAAGSGQATIPLARAFGRVVATDASLAMLAEAPRHPRVGYCVARAEASCLRSASVELVTVAQALHWLDSLAFYTEARRVLVPGGVLAAWTYGNQSLDDPAMDQLLQQFYHEIVGPYWAPERRHVESGYQTLSFPFPELEPPTIVMEERWSLTELLGYVRTWSATQRFRKSRSRDPVEQLEGELRPLWGDPRSRRRIHWPLSIRAGRSP